MKLKEIMSQTVVKIHPDESAEVAARTFSQYNIGLLPVCDDAGRLQGVVTDRDLVTRCLAAGKIPTQTKVGEIMTKSVTCAAPDMEVGVAAHLMGRKQIRRLPVLEQGKLCGMVSLGDLANREDCSMDAADALGEICANISNG